MPKPATKTGLRCHTITASDEEYARLRDLGLGNASHGARWALSHVSRWPASYRELARFLAAPLEVDGAGNGGSLRSRRVRGQEQELGHDPALSTEFPDLSGVVLDLPSEELG